MNRRHSPHGVLAIVLALTAVVGTGAQGQRSQGREFQVPAWQQWIPTGIGRIDAPGPFGQRNSRAFLIGDQQSVAMPLDGELLLGINDSSFADNRRTFTVRVEGR